MPQGIGSFTWSCEAAGGASCGTSGGVGNLSETVSLPPEGIVTYTVVAGLTDAEEVVVNTATITVPAEVGDPIAGNNRSVNRSSSSVPVYLPVISNRR
jgi:hypothetical protein